MQSTLEALRIGAKKIDFKFHIVWMSSRGGHRDPYKKFSTFLAPIQRAPEYPAKRWQRLVSMKFKHASTLPKFGHLEGGFIYCKIGKIGKLWKKCIHKAKPLWLYFWVWQVTPVLLTMSTPQIHMVRNQTVAVVHFFDIFSHLFRVNIN